MFEDTHPHLFKIASSKDSCGDNTFHTLRRGPSELRNSHPTAGCFNSLEGPSVGTADREVPSDIVAVDDEVPYLPMPVRKCGEQGRELRRNRGWIHRDVVDFDDRCINEGIPSKSCSLHYSR